MAEVVAQGIGQLAADVVDLESQLVAQAMGENSGRNPLLHHGSGLDIVEAIVSQPMSQITLREALEALDGQVVLQGGIPSVLVCEQGGSRDDFKRYIEDTVLPEKDRTGFVLGMSDNVPPDADFGRIEMVADLIRTRNPR